MAYSLVSPSGYRGEPLTERKILEVVSLLDEIKVSSDTYQQLKNTFDAISKDPRMQVSLEASIREKWMALLLNCCRWAKKS